jgi:hypothetical protein
MAIRDLVTCSSRTVWQVNYGTAVHLPYYCRPRIAKHLSTKIGTTFCIREERHWHGSTEKYSKRRGFSCTSHCSGTIVRAT